MSALRPGSATQLGSEAAAAAVAAAAAAAAMATVAAGTPSDSARARRWRAAVPQ